MFLDFFSMKKRPKTTIYFSTIVPYFSSITSPIIFPAVPAVTSQVATQVVQLRKQRIQEVRSIGAVRRTGGDPFRKVIQ